ncbi:unnamed protein product [Parascedosporium putredinis]|uniref:feruloyl esterase n=1 Tax=Parascedosporium putredinis TaxID=1442378 RepID=A0A9P1H0B5_9PEZI|nr:unnamed protein product [Parascedosporium putredinis]CAI7992610.1 unnamed protein product [Parascedosporium putredinis]
MAQAGPVPIGADVVTDFTPYLNTILKRQESAHVDKVGWKSEDQRLHAKGCGLRCSREVASGERKEANADEEPANLIGTIDILSCSDLPFSHQSIPPIGIGDVPIELLRIVFDYLGDEDRPKDYQSSTITDSAKLMEMLTKAESWGLTETLPGHVVGKLIPEENTACQPQVREREWSFHWDSEKPLAADPTPVITETSTDIYEMEDFAHVPPLSQENFSNIEKLLHNQNSTGALSEAKLPSLAAMNTIARVPMEKDNSVVRQLWYCQCLILNLIDMSYSGDGRMMDISEEALELPKLEPTLISLRSESFALSSSPGPSCFTGLIIVCAIYRHIMGAHESIRGVFFPRPDHREIAIRNLNAGAAEAITRLLEQQRGVSRLTSVSDGTIHLLSRTECYGLLGLTLFHAPRRDILNYVRCLGESSPPTVEAYIVATYQAAHYVEGGFHQPVATLWAALILWTFSRFTASADLEQQQGRTVRLDRDWATDEMKAWYDGAENIRGPSMGGRRLGLACFIHNAAVLAARSTGCGKQPSLNTGIYNTTVGAKARQYYVRLPENYDRGHPYRLVFAYHQFGSSMESIVAGEDLDAPLGGALRFFGLLPLANETAIFVVPDGLDRRWANIGGEDIQFFDDMVSTIGNALCIEETLRFSTGFSFGGSMSFAIACARPDIIRAIAVLSGAQLSGCEESEESPYGSRFTDSTAQQTKCSPLRRGGSYAIGLWT